MITIDHDKLMVIEMGIRNEYPMASKEAFKILSGLWLRSSCGVKYSYTFTWLGRPMVQLPEDILRIQEVIYTIKPDVIVETGVAHGGSLIFYAGLCKAIGKGKVIGIDIEIRPHNRKAIESHELFSYVTLIEGSSIEPSIIKRVRSSIKTGQTAFVILDSNHAKDHVLKELRSYADIVTPGSYIVVQDGIMKDLAGLPFQKEDCAWNNPYEAVQDFLKERRDFTQDPPPWLFNESAGWTDPVTYWPGAWLKKKKC